MVEQELEKFPKMDGTVKNAGKIDYGVIIIFFGFFERICKGFL